jgi:predicted glutamine amidotransferase
MCRMIVAVGTFDVEEIFAGAVAMASGLTADHDGPFTVHPDGWGAVWHDSRSPTGLGVMRGIGPVTDQVIDALGSAVPTTDFLAIHVRRATRSTTKGPRFTHPLARSDGWHFMHNGYLPTAHRMLGLEKSAFDSAEYFDYVIPVGAEKLDQDETLDRLRALPAGGNSGNAIAVSPDRGYLIHWRQDHDTYPRYFTMRQLIESGRHVIASEVIPAIAPPGRWDDVPADTVLEFGLT